MIYFLFFYNKKTWSLHLTEKQIQRVWRTGGWGK